MLRLLKNRSLILIYIIIFISIFTSTLSGGAVLVLYALELGATVTEITLINMLVGLFNTIFQLPLGIIADRVGRKFWNPLPRNYGFLANIARGYATTPLQLIMIAPFGGQGAEISDS